MENYSSRGAYFNSSRRGGKFERPWPGGPRQTSWPGRVAKQRILRQRRANSYSSSDPLNLRWVAQETLRRELAGESPMPGDSAFNSPVPAPASAAAPPVPAQPAAEAAPSAPTASTSAMSSSLPWRMRRSSAEASLAAATTGASASAQQYGRQRSMTFFKRPPPHRFVPVYGNYRAARGGHHCGRGGGLNMDRMQDDRLQLLQPDWYTDKDVLDIGCNDGVFSLKIAESLRVRSLTGVDIDAELVHAARGNLRRKLAEADEEAQLRRQLAREGFRADADADAAAPAAVSVDLASASASAGAGALGLAEPAAAAAAAASDFPRNVSFIVGNYVPDSEEQLAQVEENKYDIIQAFSITKWIHLNWGDRGLKLFFRRAFKELKPDGKFIVEPQPYHSYKRQLLCAAHKRNYACNIALKPETFRAYLEQEVGFAHILSISEQQQCHGFQRPVLMCSKPTGCTPAAPHLHHHQLQHPQLHQQHPQQQLMLQHRPLPRAESAERMFMDYMAAASSTTIDTPRSLRLPPLSPAGAPWEAELDAEPGIRDGHEADSDNEAAAMELPVQVG